MGVILRILVKSVTKQEYKKTFRMTFILMLILGLFIASLGSTVLPIVYSFVFMDHQAGAMTIFKILNWSIPIMFIGHLTTQCLVLQNNRYLLLGITLGGAVMNVILNFILIKSHGVSGAAVATVITEACILFFSSYYVIKRLGVHIGLN